MRTTLTENAIRAANPNITLWDASVRHFGLRVTPAGAKSFIVLLRSGRRRAIGRHPTITLAQARVKARQILAEKTLGRFQEQTISWSAALEQFLAFVERKNRSRTHKEYRRALNRYFPFGTTRLPDPTLATFRDIVANGLDSYWQYFDDLLPANKRFLETQFDSKTYLETRNQLVWRLDYLMTNQLLSAMFNSPKTKFDISKEMDAGKIIIINNSKDLLEEEGAEFFGRFFIAWYSRPRSSAPAGRAMKNFPASFTSTSAITSSNAMSG